ncbi:MAG TPA: helix-turn-helix transcriptional regulator [bacterium]|nr:helix-turn-helix transcriptional regulator [bacterium]
MSDALVSIAGKNLRRLRRQRGLSLDRLAEVSGVSRAMISHVELGQSAPTIVTLDKIAKGLGVSIMSFLNHILSEPPPDRLCRC